MCKPREDEEEDIPVKRRSKCKYSGAYQLSVPNALPAKETTCSPPPSVTSWFHAPNINTNTSEDKAVVMKTVASRKTAKAEKSLQSDNGTLHKSQGKPARMNKGKSTQTVKDSSSVSESDSESGEDEDEEEGLSLLSGLEDLEKKNPGTLKAKLDSEVGTQLLPNLS